MPLKRKTHQYIFSKIKEDKYDVCLLQDIHWNSATFKLAREEWGFSVIGATFNILSRGTAILLNDTYEFNLDKTINDGAGNYNIIELHLPTGLFQ